MFVLHSSLRQTRIYRLESFDLRVLSSFARPVVRRLSSAITSPIVLVLWEKCLHISAAIHFGLLASKRREHVGCGLIRTMADGRWWRPGAVSGATRALRCLWHEICVDERTVR